ncbi:hypothetical protein RJ639_023582 [Escallonia herrerae]|uniref:Uncharacterized protein n=1 Tax=Escallonia herrerae TaxID=1293975 RepID=A0AA88V025_9ASTE|nr:hypothetical protein RJ639_023582 [Escallonia herrerae]
MNSMFSSFDAVCAELLGQTGRALVSPSKKVDGFLQSHQQTQKREQTKVTDEANEKKAGRQQRRARSPLDCLEEEKRKSLQLELEFIQASKCSRAAGGLGT